jgi:MFS family permease
MIIGGGIADRYNRAFVLRLSSLGAGLSQAGVAIVLLTHQDPRFLLPAAALNGIFQALTTPTMRGIVPQLATGRGIQVANSLLASTRNLARMIGPAAAGLLTVSVGGGWAIAADAASFFLAAVCFGRVSIPSRPPRATGSSTMVGDLREGWTYFSSNSWIWSVTLAFAVLNAAYMGIWQILGPVIALDTIGAAGWGLVLSARATGSLLATVVMVKLTVRRPMVWALSLMTLSAVPLILLGTGANALWLAAAAFAAGVAAEFFTVVWSTVCHLQIPERLLSRVGAYDEFGSFASIPLGQLSVPFLAAAFGTAAVAITGGALLAVAMLLPLLLPSLRRIEITR